MVLPKTLLENWKRELERWSPHIRPTVYHGTHKQQAVADLRAGRSRLLFTTYDTMARDASTLAELRWESAFFDEAHELGFSVRKGLADTKRHIAAGRLLGPDDGPTLRFVASGTIAKNPTKGDCWVMMNFVQPGQFGSFTEFQSEFSKKIDVGYTAHCTAEERAAGDAAQRGLTAMLARAQQPQPSRSFQYYFQPLPFLACCERKNSQKKKKSLLQLRLWLPGCGRSSACLALVTQPPLTPSLRPSSPPLVCSSAVLLRRTKEMPSVQKDLSEKGGSGGWRMPKKSDSIVYCRLSPLQARAYQRLLDTEEFQLLIKANDDCDCESGEIRRKCCYTSCDGPIFQSMDHRVRICYMYYFSHSDSCVRSAAVFGGVLAEVEGVFASSSSAVFFWSKI